MTIQENVPLAPLTTLQVGGPARYFASPSSPEQVGLALDFARSRSLALFVLGGGSNLVVSDAGWPGLVLRVAIRGIEELDPGVFTVGAGEDWDGFVAQAVERNMAGVECLSGIPGSAGGTPIQNVGAYGQEVSSTIERVQVLDCQTGEFRYMENAECGFKYRKSVFNSSTAGRYIVLRVTYRLAPNGAPKLEYEDLQQYFANHAAPPTLAETRTAVREIRSRKSMLISKNDPDSRSAGSFFQNPVIPLADYDRLAKTYTLPHRWDGPGRVKIPAAWVVENAGFHKGFVPEGIASVGISSKHSLAVINRGGASAQDIADFKDQIVGRVWEMFGIALQPEPVFLGEFKSRFRAAES